MGLVMIPSLLHFNPYQAEPEPEPHSIQQAPMTLAAACRSMTEGAYPYYPARDAECGCGRCSS